MRGDRGLLQPGSWGPGTRSSSGVEYPWRGFIPVDMALPMLESVWGILLGLEKVVFDMWFSVGLLLECLGKLYEARGS